MPTVNASPLGLKMQRVLASGLPAVGNLLFAYVAGSVSTKQNTYTDYTGTVANTNPIVLNSLGDIPLQVWLTAGQGFKFVYAPANDTDPPSSPIWTVDSVYGINDVTTSQTEWVSGPTPTYVGATSFTLVGDQTSTFQVGRRVRTTNSGGTIYSRIATSVYGVLTTVTVVNDSGTLDAGLSAVSYGLLSATNPSVPAFIIPLQLPSGQIVFPAVQIPSANANTLDNYAEVPVTLTLTGCTTSPTYAGTLTRIGNQRTLILPGTSVVGATSNTTSKTLTGLAAGDAPSGRIATGLCSAADNGGVYAAIGVAIIETTGVITLSNGQNWPGGTTNWTAANAMVFNLPMMSWTIA